MSCEEGLDISFLSSITDQYGSIDKQKARDAGYTIEDGDKWITKEVDVLIPAALEGQINGCNRSKCSSSGKDHR